MSKIEVEKFGLNDVQHRKEWFRQKAARKLQEAEDLKKDAVRLLDMADKLDKYNTEATVNTMKMIKEGKHRLDGKTAEAMYRRGLENTCGIVKIRARLHCTNDKLELQEVWYADKWFVDVVEGLKKAKLTAQERKEFYDLIVQYKDEPEGIESEAGLIILGRMKG